MTPSRKEMLAREYERCSLAQMAEVRGVTWQAVQQMLKREGIPLRPRGGDFRRWIAA